MGRAAKDERDVYYRKAKESGFRARSAYKLLQVNDEYAIFRGVTHAVDLCAAPGSWSQVLSGALKENSPTPKIVAVDLQEMAPIDGVTILQGDITTIETAQQVISSLGNVKAELVVSDGAPDVTGLHDVDEYLQHQLLLAALSITTFILAPNGTFVAKMFRGPETSFCVAKLQLFFEYVTVFKPKSSRSTSLESFVVCQNFSLPAGYVPSIINPFRQQAEGEAQCEEEFGVVSLVNKRIGPFLAMGDLSAFDDVDLLTESSSSRLTVGKRKRETPK